MTAPESFFEGGYKKKQRILAPEIAALIERNGIDQVHADTRKLRHKVRDQERAEVGRLHYRRILEEALRTLLASEKKELTYSDFVRLFNDIEFAKGQSEEAQKEELQYHVQQVISILLATGLMYTQDGTHMINRKQLEKKLAAMDDPEAHVARYPYDTVKEIPESVPKRLAQLANRDPDSFTPRQKSVRRLGNLASSEAVPDSQS